MRNSPEQNYISDYKLGLVNRPAWQRRSPGGKSSADCVKTLKLCSDSFSWNTGQRQIIGLAMSNRSVLYPGAVACRIRNDNLAALIQVLAFRRLGYSSL